MGEHHPDISVVVPVRNGANHLPALLAALEEQTLDPCRFEVVLVDDQSTDGTRKLLTQWVTKNESRRCVLCGLGKGPGAARNVGVAQSLGQWIAFTDSDTMPEPNWLDKALKAVERTRALAVEGSIHPWPEEAVSAYTHQACNQDGGRYMTANMIYAKVLLDNVGGFDERFEQFLEDSDLAFRVMNLGVEIPFCPDLRVRHAVFQRSIWQVLASSRRVRFIPLLASKHPVRYHSSLRGKVRPLSRVNMHVLVGFVGLGSMAFTRRGWRFVSVLTLLNGLRVAAASSGLFVQTDNGERATRVTLSLFLPLARAFWLLEGCVRFRHVAW